MTMRMTFSPDALAGRIAGTLRDAIAARGVASLALAGGSTPKPVYAALARCALDWSKVVVTLTDERLVPATHVDSNARMLRETLLSGDAAAARFVPFATEAPDPVAATAAALEAVPMPFDLVLLGMGTDGHIASLFPDAEGLAEGLEGDAAIVAVLPPGALGRLSLTMATLRQARDWWLVIGSDKRPALATAREDGPIAAMPVRALLRDERVPLLVAELG